MPVIGEGLWRSWPTLFTPARDIEPGEEVTVNLILHPDQLTQVRLTARVVLSRTPEPQPDKYWLYLSRQADGVQVATVDARVSALSLHEPWHGAHFWLSGGSANEELSAKLPVHTFQS